VLGEATNDDAGVDTAEDFAAFFRGKVESVRASTKTIPPHDVRQRLTPTLERWTPVTIAEVIASAPSFCDVSGVLCGPLRCLVLPSLSASSFVWPLLCSAVATRLHRTTWRYSGQTRTTRGVDCDRRQLGGCSCVAHDYERSALFDSTRVYACVSFEMFRYAHQFPI